MSVTWLPARPTEYRGIRMRSRLEADFARWLDSDQCNRRLRGEWDYEPECFADETGQYLPDFRVTRESGVELFIEVKPCDWFLRSTDEVVDPLLERMEVIWSSRPNAILALVTWLYQDTAPIATWISQARKGWTFVLDETASPWVKRADW